ncbi:MAG: hypothetical protein M3Q57_01400, partial [Pseudomonadota bacterium]|nr:hypothetical protein [Pseudomonadota bacterium]
MDDLWDDLKAPVRDAGEGGQLNTFPEFSVAFWRWSIWKMFEAEGAPQRGVIAFITNRKFLTGWPYAGLRQMMRERFDRIELIDLRGDVRAGPRGDVADDTGVFNIQVGTSITILIADGSKAEGELADVTYMDSWSANMFARRAKLDWLSGASEHGSMANAVQVVRNALDDMRPAPFQNGEWLTLPECFAFSGSGMQTKRDNFAYAVKTTDLTTRLTLFATEPSETARERFHDSRDRKWTAARATLFDENGSFAIQEASLTLVGYRPFDRRVLYNHPAFGDFLRPALQRASGHSNSALYGLPLGTGAGPAIWCHGLVPDYHSFRGSYGGYAFPLYDRREGPDATNLSPVLLASLGEAYGQVVTAEDAFDAILALLSATSYTRRFAEDLEDVFPHIPFPADHAVLMRAITIGGEIRTVET